MAALRILVASLPQVLLVLLIGGKYELLGGWNHTDSAFGTLIVLFLVTPLAAAILLVIEATRYLVRVRRKDEARSFVMPAVAIFLFLEALAVDLYVLSQVKMH